MSSLSLSSSHYLVNTDKFVIKKLKAARKCDLQLTGITSLSCCMGRSLVSSFVSPAQLASSSIFLKIAFTSIINCVEYVLSNSISLLMASNVPLFEIYLTPVKPCVIPHFCLSSLSLTGNWEQPQPLLVPHMCCPLVS